MQQSLKQVAELPEDERDLSGANKFTLLKALVHSADIGNPTRNFDIATTWARRIVQEFFH